MVISFALRKGDEAKKELDEMDGSLTDAEYELIPETGTDSERSASYTDAPMPRGTPTFKSLTRHLDLVERRQVKRAERIV
jgi:hypothetical protein